MSATILIIDDETQIRKLLRITLEAAGFTVRDAANGIGGLSETAYLKPDLVILDLGLPDLGGAEVIRRIREWSEVPILVLSVRDEAGEKVEALESGADDYVTKPFDGMELVARCRSLLRRRERRAETSVFENGPLRIDFVVREVRFHKSVVDLTNHEYALLLALASNVGRVVTHSQILREVWGPAAEEQRQYLRVYIAALRRKLPGIRVETVTGIGYRLVAEDP